MMSRDAAALRGAQGRFDEIFPSRFREIRNAFARALSAALARAEITYGEWRCLRVLWDDDGIAQRDLAERLDMTSAATVFAVNLLERDGIARRVPDRSDRRRLSVQLTAKGHGLRKTLLTESRRIHSRALRHLSDEEVETLSGLLDKVQLGLAEEIGRMQSAEKRRDGKPVSRTGKGNRKYT